MPTQPATGYREPTMKYTREVTAAILSPVAIWVIGWSHPYVFDGVVGLISGLALYEQACIDGSVFEFNMWTSDDDTEVD